MGGGLAPSIGTGLGTGFGASGLGASGGMPMPARGTPSLGMLSSQALAQQPAAMRTGLQSLAYLVLMNMRFIVEVLGVTNSEILIPFLSLHVKL